MSDLESLKNLLVKGMGRLQIDMIVQAVELNKDLFDELMRIYLSNEEPASRQAAWVLDIVTERDPMVSRPWIENMARMLPEFLHDGLKRHTLRMLSILPLPDENLGILIKSCFDLLSAKESVAVKVYAMEILYRVSEREPDLKMELADTISWRLHEESPGFRNKGLKILKKLSL